MGDGWTEALDVLLGRKAWGWAEKRCLPYHAHGMLRSRCSASSGTWLDVLTWEVRLSKLWQDFLAQYFFRKLMDLNLTKP
jgi:hypothetical protein